MVPDALKVLKNNLNVRFDDKVVGGEISQAYLHYLKHNYFFNYSGLIFTGFGEKELFPQLIPLNVSVVVENKLRFEIDDAKTASINNQMNACIRPFAQTDVIDTILQGISPELNHLSVDVFGNFIQAFLKEITQIKDMPEEAIKRLEALNISNYIAQYQENFGNIIRHKYVNPLMEAVAQLSKEDLSEMAESLVYLTYLKRRFTLAEESVGGPVDIAVITKGDGFVWIKRKQYFDPQLNQSFFQRYL
ncbi:MAG: hypothetical protein ACLFQS_08365 [Bacteroidales bacterium]